MSTQASFPALRWVAAAWFALWFPTYAMVWGWGNFIQFCDVSVFLTVAGLWTGSALLLSSQAVAAIVINTVWTLDVLWRLVLGQHLLGGTEYLWDARYPLWVRLLSLYHVVVPVLLLWAVRRTGYNPRGWLLQAGISVPVLIASRFVSPEKNYNFSIVDPILQHAFRPAALHLAIILFFLIFVVYWPTHQILLRTYPPAQRK